MRILLALALASSLLASCSSVSSPSSFSIIPGLAAWDADLYQKSPVVLRVEILAGHDHLRKHRMFPVRVLQTYKNDSGVDIAEHIEVASSAEWGGLPACGKCTVYLKPNPSKQKNAPALALDEPSGVYIQKHTPAYSHHAFPKTGPNPALAIKPTNAKPKKVTPDTADTPDTPAEPQDEPAESLADFANRLAGSKKGA